MTEAYPLRWPDGWPKTPAADRTRGREFTVGSRDGGKSHITFARARRGLIDELERLKAQSVVISTSIELRADGVPRAGIDPDRYTIREPGVAVYFTLKGRQMQMARDAYDNPAANLRSLAKVVEAMRMIERHGGNAMMGRAFDGFAALPPPEGVAPRRPWWEVLRFPSAPEDRELISVAEVQARHKTLAKKLHPDAGGNDFEMAELNVALEDAKEELERPQ